MRNVSLKVLEKSLKFLFKKGYEPGLQSEDVFFSTGSFTCNLTS